MRKGMPYIRSLCSLLTVVFFIHPAVALAWGELQKPAPILQAKPPVDVNVNTILKNRPALPDLVPVSCIFDPASAKPGTDPILLKVKYKNAGTADAVIEPRAYEFTAVPATGMNVSETNLSSAAITVKPGEERWATLTRHTSLSLFGPGTHTFTVTIDPKNVVAESNESNNQMACTLTILPPGGDLSIARTYVTPSEPVSTQAFWVEVVVTNTGKTDPITIPQGTLIVSAPPFASDIYVTESNGRTLQPGASVTYGLKPTSAGKQKGMQTWTITIDPMNRVLERSETNNQGTIPVTLK